MRIGLIGLFFSFGSFGCASAAHASVAPPRITAPLSHATAPKLAPQPRGKPSGAATDAFVAVPHLVDRLNQSRSSHGSETLSIDSMLSHIAGTAAKQAARLGRGAEQHVADDLNAQLSRFTLAYRRVASAVLFTPALDDAFTALTPGLDPVMHYTGIAVEPIETFGAGYAVVMIVGE